MTQKKMGILLLLGVLAVDGVFMPRQAWDGDAVAWQTEARSLLQRHHLWVTPFQAADFGELGQYYVFNPADGHWYSKYGIANTLMSLPVTAAEMWLNGDDPVSDQTRVVLLNIWNILLSVLLARVLYVIAGRYSGDPRRRAGYVLACLFGTYLWFYQRLQGSEIYQALFFALFYECLLRALTPPKASAQWLLAAWLFVGLLVLTRVVFGILLPVALAACFFTRPRVPLKLAVVVLPPMVILAVLAYVNDLKFGSPWLSGYHQWHPREHLLTGSWLDGVWGMLLSGHWSIFIYFPVLLLAAPRARRFVTEHSRDAAIIGGAFFSMLLILGLIPSWRGEWSYGPRYMLFVLPIVGLPALYYGGGASGRWATAAWVMAAGLMVFSGWLQWEVNGGDFWFWYRIQQPLQGVMDRGIAEYFMDHHEGIVLYDLRAHRSNLAETDLFRRLNERGKRGVPAGYQQQVERLLDESNLFWWPAN